MTCKQPKEQLDDFVDGYLNQTERALLNDHLEACAECRADVAELRRLRVLVKRYGESDVAIPDTGFFDQALARAAHEGTRRERNRHWLRGFGSAVAAGLALLAVSLLFLHSPDVPDADAGIPAVTMALEEPRTVNLVFASAIDLVDATLTVVLPEGIDVAGFEGQREITWTTSLQAGKNVLPLELVASSPRGGELLATLRHGNDDRTFRLRVNISS